MNKLFYFLFLISLPSSNIYANDGYNIDFIHPLNWFSGMKESKFQVMIHGKDIAKFNVKLKNNSRIELVETVKVKNPNYIILYLDAKNASPQTFDICFCNSDKIVNSIQYQLKPKKNRVINSFSSADVIYLLMPDRFANGDTDNDNVLSMREPKADRNVPLARHGGDIKGIIDHLEYLAELGVTALWTTPVLENNMQEESYHGYATTDYYHVDPRFGNNDDFKLLVDKAHEKGIKIIMDLVFNHCGSFNPIFLDLPQDDWFNFKSKYTQSSYRTGAVGDVNASVFDKTRTTDGWFVKTMPDWNQRNPLVKDYLIQSSLWWIETAGIDGIRQDTYPYNDFEAMVEWCNRIENEYPGMNIVGEAWINNNVGVAYWQKDSKLAPKNSMLKSVMDFPLMALLNWTIDQETDEWDHGLAKIYDYISQDVVFENTNNLLTFLDNHDTDRFQKNTEMANDTTRYKLALTLLLTLRGIPQLYYGDEIGMAADKSKGDGALRQDFPGGWKEDANNAFNNEGRNNLQNWYYNFTRNLLQWRKSCKPAHVGKLTHFHVRNGVYAYSRIVDNNAFTVFMNGTSEKKHIDISPYKEVLPKNMAYDVIKNKKILLNDSLTIQPKDVILLDFKSF